MVQEHHVAVLPVNHVSVLCMRLCVSGGFHTQYTYMIGPGVQPHGAPRPCKYFSRCESADLAGAIMLLVKSANDGNNLQFELTSWFEESGVSFKAIVWVVSRSLIQ